ncbi:hypothetical protein PMAC_001036 [Pneumocystis sp. 'macacae']|nr:hypothetical protein PMAC_001036 [Pneumocystis sp. 'macacae']
MGICDNSDDFVGFRAPRSLSDVLYGQNHPAAKEIRCGSLERRTKIFKSYNSGFYVLTPSGFLHEFKSSNLSCDQMPIMSLSLRDYEISDHSPVNAKSYKFSLKRYKCENSNRLHILVFRTKTYQELLDWYNDIKKFAGRSYMSDEEFRDYIVALQMENILDNQIIYDQNGVSDQKKHSSQDSDSDFKDTIDLITSVSHREAEPQVLDMNHGKDKISGENMSFIEKGELSILLSDNISSGQNSNDNVSIHAPVVLGTPNVYSNDSDNQKEVATLKSSLRDSSYYSSTDECPCPSKPQESFDFESDLDKQSNNLNRKLSDSLYIPLQSQMDGSKSSVLLESQINNEEFSPMSSPVLDQSSVSIMVQTKFEEDLGNSISHNTDEAHVSTDKLSLEKTQLSVSLKSAESLVNGEYDASNKSFKVSDATKSLCSSRESLNKLECQVLSGTSDSMVLGKSCSVEELDGDLQEQILNNNNVILK